MLNVKNVYKLYGKSVGIKNINIELEDGKVYGIIGPNGSGKTTFARCIVGLRRIDKGSIKIDGVDTNELSVKQKIGFSVDLSENIPKMSVLELLEYVCEIKYDGENLDKIEQLLRAYNLWEERGKMIESCSMGMKKKVELIISFLGDPELIILDEPTNAVDAEGIIVLKEHIKEATKRGATVFIASHVLDFVAKVSDECVFIREGKIVEKTTNMDELEEKYKEIYI